MSNPGHGIQICFCAGNSQALPVEPLDAHDSFCLVWDWAMARGMITPSQFLAKLGDATAELGFTPEEISAEEASFQSSKDDFIRNAFSCAPFRKSAEKKRKYLQKGLPW